MCIRKLTVQFRIQVGTDGALFSRVVDNNRVRSIIQLLASRASCGPVHCFEDRTIAAVRTSDKIEFRMTC